MSFNFGSEGQAEADEQCEGGGQLVKTVQDAVIANRIGDESSGEQVGGGEKAGLDGRTKRSRRADWKI